MIDAGGDQPVVARHDALGRELDTYQQADLLLDRADEGFDELERLASLEAAVEVHEGDARLALPGAAGLDHVADRLARGLGLADVIARRAEPAVQPRLPEVADRVDVYPEIRALQ